MFLKCSIRIYGASLFLINSSGNVNVTFDQMEIFIHVHLVSLLLLSPSCNFLLWLAIKFRIQFKVLFTFVFTYAWWDNVMVISYNINSRLLISSGHGLLVTPHTKLKPKDDCTILFTAAVWQWKSLKGICLVFQILYFVCSLD